MAADMQRLAKGLIHELATPMNVVGMRAEVILQEPVSQLVRDSAQVIQAQVERMSAVLQQFLEFVRPREPQYEVDNLSKLVADAVAEFQQGEVPSGVAISLQSDPEATFVDVDAGQLRQALKELLLNAVESMPQGGTIQVRVSNALLATGSSRHGERPLARIDVEDQGSGVSPSVVGRIFEPFFSTKKNGTAFGLGLAVVERFAREHNGSVTVDSCSGQGACFSIFLPLAADGVPDRQHSNPTPNAITN